MEGREKSSRSGDFEDATDMTLIWSRCQEDLIAGMVERIGEIVDTRYFVGYTVVLEVDVLIPRDAWPVISWHTFIHREHECVISMGIDHWEFISRGASSFVRTTMDSVKAKIRDDAKIGTVAMKERTSKVFWKFNVMMQSKDGRRTGDELIVHSLRGDGPYDEDNLGGPA